jgi:hypothetical protein
MNDKGDDAAHAALCAKIEGLVAEYESWLGDAMAEMRGHTPSGSRLTAVGRCGALSSATADLKRILSDVRALKNMPVTHVPPTPACSARVARGLLTVAGVAADVVMVGCVAVTLHVWREGGAPSVDYDKKEPASTRRERAGRL